MEKVCPEGSDRQHENVNTNAANANMVLLEKQLQLEKKHDLQQFCHRLNLLGGSFFHGVEGIDASAKGTYVLKPGNFRVAKTSLGAAVMQNKGKQKLYSQL
ncbi:hypothetical protein C5167_036442 [Papaver somniferum]|uniref:Uncharacterized protein n=1 Tax=Papaver somniferum TaxID=3469 RepID=A0A4Y7I7S3_PAPSO|nr:hypothetical protein C5167_036442 [Papaver somniferum]